MTKMKIVKSLLIIAIFAFSISIQQQMIDAATVENVSGTDEDTEDWSSEDFDEYEYIDAPDRKTKVKKKRTKSTDYKKIATAIGKMVQEGIQVMPPNINNSSSVSSRTKEPF